LSNKTVSLKAFSTNNYDEMYFFGGIVTSGQLSDVWKFKYSDNSWQKLGNITPRLLNTINTIIAKCVKTKMESYIIK